MGAFCTDTPLKTCISDILLTGMAAPYNDAKVHPSTPKSYTVVCHVHVHRDSI